MQLVRRLLIIFLFSALIIAGTYFALPSLLTYFLAPKITAELPFSSSSLEISKITTTEIVASVTLGDSASVTAFHVPRLTIRYTLAGLRARRIESVTIDSASITLAQKDKTYVIPGLQNESTGGDNTNTGIPLLPVAVDSVQFRNLKILLDEVIESDKLLLVNGSVIPSLIESESGYTLNSISADAQISGDLSAHLVLDFLDDKDQQKADIKMSVNRLGALANFYPLPDSTTIKGRMELEGTASLENFAHLQNFQGSISFPELGINREGLSIISEESAPLAIIIQGTPTEIQANLINGRTRGSFPSAIALTAHYLMKTGSFDISGNVTPEEIAGEFSVTAKGTAGPAAVEFSYALTGKTVSYDQAQADTVKISGNGSMRDDTIITTSKLDVSKIHLPAQKLSLTRIEALLPLTFPLSATPAPKAGTLKATGIYIDEMELGKLSGTFTPLPEHLTFSLNSEIALHSGVSMLCNGEAQYTGSLNVDCNIPQTPIDTYQLAPSITTPENMHFNGLLTAEMNIGVEKGIPSGSAKINLAQGEFTSGNNIVSGIALSATFPNLPLAESSPSQICTIQSISAGQIALTDGKIIFRIEGPDSLFIERSRFSWCGGKVETGGLRLASDSQDVQTTLYCDRLNLAQLLSQFGIVDTEGEGSLNGRIPLLINKSGIEIEDGFLFSTPGNSGIVHFNNTEQIREGLPNIEQTAYLDYAVKSLENFSYNWTKLTLNQEKNDLLVTLQLDGAPAEPLPFGYKDGSIVKTRQGPGMQHPVRLDVNFRLPLKDLFRYGKNVQSIMENM